MAPVLVPYPVSHSDPNPPPLTSSPSVFLLNPNSSSPAPSSLHPDPPPSTTAGASISSPYPPPPPPVSSPSDPPPQPSSNPISTTIHPASLDLSSATATSAASTSFSLSIAQAPSYAVPAASISAPSPHPWPAVPPSAIPHPVSADPPPSPPNTALFPPLGLHPRIPPKPPLAAPPSTSSRPDSSARPPPAFSPACQSSQHHQPSYAQVARGPRGPGFVRAHASEIEHFARLPRTGAKIICGSREGMPSFSFVNTDLPRVEELYSKALVMKFLRGRPSLESSHKEISSWGIGHSFTIGPLSSRAFLLRFQEESDLLKVLTRPSSTLITFPYKIYRWHNLCHLKEDSCLAPVWISLPRLPLQCFIPEFLESVANKIGRFLCLDKATATLARPSAARMCVELDLRKPPPLFIWVGLFDGLKQPIVYEKLPKFCNGCNIQGHSDVECSKGTLDDPQPTAIPRYQSMINSTPSDRRNASANQPSSDVPAQPASTCPLNPNPSSSTTLLPGEAAPHIPDQIPHPPQNSACSSNPRPSTPHHPTRASTLKHTEKQQHKSVAFSAPQSNLVANQNFWEAMNRQVALLEQARLKAPTVDAGNNSTPNLSLENQTQPVLQEASRTGTCAAGSPSVCHYAEPNSANNVNLVEDQQIDLSKEPPNPAAKPIKIKQPDVDQSPSLNQQQQDALERFKQKVRAQTQSQGQQPIGSTSAYPFEALVEDQSDEEDDDYTAATFNSDTDDGFVEPIDMGYQSADGRSSHNHTKSSAPVMKTNKRHPNIPLNVRLRARKNSYSSSHKYLCM